MRTAEGRFGTALAVLGLALAIGIPAGQALGINLTNREVRAAFAVAIVLFLVGIGLGAHALWSERRERPTVPATPASIAEAVAASDRTRLEVEHGDTKPFRIVEKPDARYVWHHVGVHNVGGRVADNVQLELTAVEPRPRDVIFRSHLPRPIPLRDSRETVARISPGQVAYFRIAQTWRRGGDDMPIVAGIDGWSFPNDEAKIELGLDEVWHLQYELSAANAPTQTFTIEMDVGERNLVHCRLLPGPPQAAAG